MIVIDYRLSADRIARRASRSPSSRRSLLSPLGSIQDYEKLAVIGEGSYATVFKVGQASELYSSPFNTIVFQNYLQLLFFHASSGCKSVHSMEQ